MSVELCRRIGHLLGSMSDPPTGSLRDRLAAAATEQKSLDDFPEDLKTYVLDQEALLTDDAQAHYSHPQGRSAMPNLDALLAEGERLRPSDERHQRPLGAPDRADAGYRVERPQAKDGETDQTTAGPTKLYIYSDIGGWFGVWPEDVIKELAGIPGDIELHLHSPGGDAFDGIAIYNAFKQHPGKVYGSVDGLAASAASVIAMACDDLKMSKGSQLMIHDAWGFAQGPAEDMGKMQTFLDKISNSIAEVYAARAGGTPASWRKAMKAESWYTDKEAVEAGLATRIEPATAAAKNRWNLGVFNHAGREAAPAPQMPGGRHPLAEARTTQPGEPPAEDRPIDYAALEGLAREVEQEQVTPARAAALMHAAAQRAKARTDSPAPTPGAGPSHSTEGAVDMPFDRDKIREALGLGPDATDEAVQSAWTAAYAPTPPAPATPPAVPADTTDDNMSRLAKMAKDMGVTIIDPYQLTAMQEMAAQGQAAYRKQRADERDQEIQKALDLGKIELSRKDYWQKKWDADPEGARETLNALAPNLVPMEAAGYAGSVAANESDSRLYDLYPEMKSQGGRR